MSEMVDRLTRVLVEDGLPRGIPSHMICSTSVAEYRHKVRLLLTALRIPERAMQQAVLQTEAYEALADATNCSDETLVAYFTETWRAMIDEALADSCATSSDPVRSDPD